MKLPLTPFMLTAIVFNANAEEFPALDKAMPMYRYIDHQTPLFDFDNDGCYPAGGISRKGKRNSGLKTSGALNGSCHDSGFLKISNTLHRYSCVGYNGAEYCGHFYALYFEKDQVSPWVDWIGHRHDWEHVAVWTKNGRVTHGSYSAHGDLNTKPLNELSRDGERIKFVYHKEGPLTHAFRFAFHNERAENHYGRWVTPPITSWFTLTGDGISNQEMRRRLNTFDYGSAHIPLKDGNFLKNLNDARPSGYPKFPQWSIEFSK